MTFNAFLCNLNAMVDLQSDEIIQRCRDNNMRVTRTLRAIVDLLVNTDSPVSVQSCAETGGELTNCDTVTLYRLLERLEEAGLVRRIGLHKRAAHFILSDSFRHRHFVCCTACGKVEVLEEKCTLNHHQEHIIEDTGYADVYHELVFYGICPACAA